MRWRSEQLRLRRDALVAAIGTLLPTWSMVQPVGGLSLWAYLDRSAVGEGASHDQEDGAAFSHAALRRGVAIVPGHLFSVTDRHHGAVRIAYVRPVAELNDAVGRLAAAWRDCR